MKFLFLLLLCCFTIAPGYTQVSLTEVQFDSNSESSFTLKQIKDHSLQYFFLDFLKVKDTAGLTAFYSQYHETSEAYHVYANTLKKKYPESWLFEKTPDAMNADSFLLATKELFFKRMRWIYTRCNDSSRLPGGIVVQKAFARPDKPKFSEGDIIDCRFQFTAAIEKYASFRIYFYSGRWYIRRSYTYCGLK